MKISKYIPRPIILIFAVLVLGMAAVLLVNGQFGALRPWAKPSLIGGPFSLLDTTGATVTEEDLHGHYSLIFFGYAREPDVTPTELRVIAAALKMLGSDTPRFKVYFVTLDPKRDRPEILKSFLGEISPDLTGLTGTPEQIAAMAKAYHVVFRKVLSPKDPETYEMDYSPLIYLMGPDEKFIMPFQYTTDAKGLADGLKRVLE